MTPKAVEEAGATEATCPLWCGIWYWTSPAAFTEAKPRPFKTTKPYTGEPAFMRKRALYFCSRECAVAGEALRPALREAARTGEAAK